MTPTHLTAQPFFADDMWGLLKVLLVVVAPVVASVLAGIWKILRGPLQEADRQLLEQIRRVDDTLRRDVSGLADRVSKAEEQTSALAGDASRLTSEINAAINEARREHTAALAAATQRQAEHDSRMAQRVTRVETMLETDGQPRRDLAPCERLAELHTPR